ncbi:MAG: cytidylate kinase family protein, partial [Gemmataceae bacterium]
TTLHVRIVAPLEERIAYMGDWLRLTPDEAAREVQMRDGRRTKFLAEVQDTSAVPYDLILNSSRLGEAGVAAIILAAVATKVPDESSSDLVLPAEAEPA